MNFKRCSFCLDEKTMSAIDRAAEINKISRSSVIRMFLELANLVPAESLKIKSPVPALLGIKSEVHHATDSK